jgi:hypothetical protein
MNIAAVTASWWVDALVLPDPTLVTGTQITLLGVPRGLGTADLSFRTIVAAIIVATTGCSENWTIPVVLHPSSKFSSGSSNLSTESSIF